MFGYRTPVKETSTKQPNASEPSSPEAAVNKVALARKSLEQKIGEAENVSKTTVIPKQKPKASTSSKSTTPEKYKSRLSEAKACLIKVRLQINNSRNLRTDIKNEVLEATDRLFRLVKDAEEERTKGEKEKPEMILEKEDLQKGKEKDDKTAIEEHSILLKQNIDEIGKLKEEIKLFRQDWKENPTQRTYAETVNGKTGEEKKNKTLHSVVITSKDQYATGEEVLETVRNTLKATEEGLRIDNVRKARDRKIILGFRTKEELGRVTDKIQKGGKSLNIEKMENKNPLIILKGVLNYNTDEDILKAFETQNRHLLGDIAEEKIKIVVKYRRKARNPLTSHVVIQVTPRIWKCLTDEGTMHIDVQKVRVADQSPLIQCSRCLGFGHGRRFCRDQTDNCSHCGGPHLRKDCADWMSKTPPSCCNCAKAGIEGVEHNAFDVNCPVRIKWDTLARSTTAYC